MAPDPWAFGWTQLLTIIGFAITIVIAFSGFRTFGRWKREKIEERKIDIALEALSVAYESKGVFDTIRNPGAFAYEWADMPRDEGESESDWSGRATYYVTLKRIDNNKEFFIKVLKLQPRFMAVFGPETEKIFGELNMARVHVQVAASSLMRRRGSDEPWSEQKAKRHAQLEADIWSGAGDDVPGGDRVDKLLATFKGGIANLCRPVVDREFTARPRWWLSAPRDP